MKVLMTGMIMNPVANTVEPHGIQCLHLRIESAMVWRDLIIQRIVKSIANGQMINGKVIPRKNLEKREALDGQPKPLAVLGVENLWLNA